MDETYDRTGGQFTTVKLQSLLDAKVNAEVCNRRDLAAALKGFGARISVHGVEAWFRRVDSNYNHPRESLCSEHATFSLPGRHWALLLELFSLTPEALDRTDEDFARFCLSVSQVRSQPATQTEKKTETKEDAQKDAQKEREADASFLQPLERRVADHLPGREDELSELLTQLAASHETSARMVLLEGAAGLGKTALIEELVRRTRESNRLCLTASCSENSYVPLLPLFDLVRLQKKDIARGGDEALRLAQELLLHIEFANSEQSKTIDNARSELFLLGSNLLVALARQAPLLLIIDDVHWLDSTTRDLLLHFVTFLRINREHRVMLVFAGREFSRELVHKLPIGDFTKRIALKPLAPAVTRKAARLKLKKDLSPIAADYIWNITRGNPLYVEQLCAHLLDSEQLEELSGKLTLAAPVDAIHVPDTLDDFYRQRFETLNANSARVLQLGSCLGAQLSADFLQLLMSELTTDELLDSLNDGERSGLLRFTQNSYEFCHPVARHAVYMAMSESKRSQQHAQIAQTISRSLPDPTPHATIEHAYHLVKGRPFTNEATTLAACHEAATHSHRLAAWPSTEYFVTNALELDEKDRGLSDEERGVLLRMRGASRHQTARPSIALQDLSLALERFQSAQNTEEYARTLSRIVRIRSNFTEVREGSDEAAEELGGYVDLLGGPANAVAADALEVLASYRLANNDSRAAQRIAEQLMSELGPTVDEDDLSDIYISRANSAASSQITAGLACLNHLDVQGALNHLLGATRWARAGNNEATLVRALQRLVVAQLVMGRIAEAMSTYRELQNFGGSTVTGEHSAVCAAMSATNAIRGDFEEALALTDDGLNLVDVTGYRFMETALVGNRVFCLLQMGSFDAALEAVDRLEVNRPRRAAALLRNSVALAADLQHPKPLPESLRLSALSEREPDVGELGRVMMLAELALSTADKEVLLGLLPKLETAERLGVVFVTSWPTQLPLLLGRVYVALGKDRDAHYCFRKSLDFARMNDLPAQLRMTRYTLATEWPGETGLLREVDAALDVGGAP